MGKKEDLSDFERGMVVTFTFIHLADAFIQSDLQCIQAIHFFVSTCVPWESNPQRNALTTEPQEHSVVGVLLLVPDELVWIFKKLLICWDFHAQPSLGFTENGPKKRKYPVSGSCVDENALLMSEENGQTG